MIRQFKKMKKSDIEKKLDNVASAVNRELGIKNDLIKDQKTINKHNNILRQEQKALAGDIVLLKEDKLKLETETSKLLKLRYSFNDIIIEQKVTITDGEEAIEKAKEEEETILANIKKQSEFLITTAQKEVDELKVSETKLLESINILKEEERKIAQSKEKTVKENGKLISSIASKTLKETELEQNIFLIDELLKTKTNDKESIEKKIIELVEDKDKKNDEVKDIEKKKVKAQSELDIENKELDKVKEQKLLILKTITKVDKDKELIKKYYAKAGIKLSL